MSLIPFPYNIIAGIVLVVGIAAGAAYAKSSYDETKRVEGDTRTHKELDPQLTAEKTRADTAENANAKLVADLQKLNAAVALQNADIVKYEADVAAAQKRAQAALAKVAATSKRDSAEIARLTAIANQPHVTEDDCVQAKQLLADVVRSSLDSVRDGTAD